MVDFLGRTVEARFLVLKAALELLFVGNVLLRALESAFHQETILRWPCTKVVQARLQSLPPGIEEKICDAVGYGVLEVHVR